MSRYGRSGVSPPVFDDLNDLVDALMLFGANLSMHRGLCRLSLKRSEPSWSLLMWVLIVAESQDPHSEIFTFQIGMEKSNCIRLRTSPSRFLTRSHARWKQGLPLDMPFDENKLLFWLLGSWKTSGDVRLLKANIWEKEIAARIDDCVISKKGVTVPRESALTWLKTRVPESFLV